MVRATGGLQDTVKEHTPENPGVGFLFGPHTTEAMLEAVGRALGFYADRAQWEAIMRRAMALDFSWERAAGEYEQLYQRAMARRAGEGRALSMGRESRFDVMAHVVEIANSSVDVAERLDNILGEITSYLDARLAVLFMQEQRGTRLASANYWPRSAALPQGLSVPFGQGALGNAARSRAPSVFTFTLPSEDPVLEQFCRNQEKVALFPVMDDNRLYAVLVLVFEKGGDLNDEDVRLLQMVVREMAGSIRNFHLYFEAKKRIAELNVLSDLGRAAVSTIEIDELLKIVAGICAKLLGAKGGLIKVRSINGEEQTMQAVHGLVPPAAPTSGSATWTKRAGPRARDPSPANATRTRPATATSRPCACR